MGSAIKQCNNMWAKNSGYDDFSQENMIFSDEITSQIYNSFGRNVVI